MNNNSARSWRLLAATLALCAAGAHAFPTKTITIVVPTAAGGGNDAMARIIAQRMAPILGATVIVDNKPGANGSIASEAVAKAAADGHTILFGYVATHAMNPALQKLRYDPVKDFEPVGLVGYSPTLMVAHPSLKARDGRELIAHLKSAPGRYSYASAGNGTAPHFAAELFKMNAGVAMLHVPYKGSAPAVSDTIGGHTHVMFPSLFTGVPQVKAGKLQAVAIAGEKRSQALPNVPTLKELGVDGVNVTQWYALFAPAKTPRPVVDKLNGALNKVLTQPEVVAQIEGHGADVETSSPDQLRKMVSDELAKWRRVVQAAKLSAD
jgi:tripartite-type tricarboxylate transporter receptor subunit TctC